MNVKETKYDAEQPISFTVIETYELSKIKVDS
jgi:hypothetical protein